MYTKNIFKGSIHGFLSVTKHGLLIFIAVLFCSRAASQTVIHGQLIDSLSRQAIAFANLTLDDGRTGTTTDIEGNFALTVPQGYTRLIYISHVSYQGKILPLPYLQNNPIIALQPGSTQLREVAVTGAREENPAFRIIRQAIAHRDENDPRALKSYQFISYNKFLVTMSEPSKKGDSLLRRFEMKRDTAKLSERSERVAQAG